MEAKNDKKELNTVQFILKVNSVIEKNIVPELTKDCGVLSLLTWKKKCLCTPDRELQRLQKFKPNP